VSDYCRSYNDANCNDKEYNYADDCTFRTIPETITNRSAGEYAWQFNLHDLNFYLIVEKLRYYYTKFVGNVNPQKHQ
jgi:hypothetical protein